MGLRSSLAYQLEPVLSMHIICLYCDVHTSYNLYDEVLHYRIGVGTYIAEWHSTGIVRLSLPVCIGTLPRVPDNNRYPHTYHPIWGYNLYLLRGAHGL